MTDEKKYTLEGDLRKAAYDLVAAMNLCALGKDRAALVNRLRKWADGKDPNEQPFDFQRSYDRGVRRFVRRNGVETTEVHWFSNSNLFYPVRDAFGNKWNAVGEHQKSRAANLIAEAPAEKQEGQGDA